MIDAAHPVYNAIKLVCDEVETPMSQIHQASKNSLSSLIDTDGQKELLLFEAASRVKAFARSRNVSAVASRGTKSLYAQAEEIATYYLIKWKEKLQKGISEAGGDLSSQEKEIQLFIETTHWPQFSSQRETEIYQGIPLVAHDLIYRKIHPTRELPPYILEIAETPEPQLEQLFVWQKYKEQIFNVNHLYAFNEIRTDLNWKEARKGAEGAKFILGDLALQRHFVTALGDFQTTDAFLLLLALQKHLVNSPFTKEWVASLFNFWKRAPLAELQDPDGLPLSACKEIFTICSSFKENRVLQEEVDNAIWAMLSLQECSFFEEDYQKTDWFLDQLCKSKVSVEKQLYFKKIVFNVIQSLQRSQATEKLAYLQIIYSRLSKKIPQTP